MGKSHRKVKNDRINAIRKQYDAFLEEDNKRRQRNEYILGQLDKIRSSTALVPITSKANYHNLELNPSDNYVRPNNLKANPEMRNTYLSHLERPNVTSGLLNTPVDEMRILKEISKKYILIPKRTRPIEKDFIYATTETTEINDTDWKTKYNILADLKKLEKENPSDPIYTVYNDENNKKHHLNTDPNISEIQSPNLDNHNNDWDSSIPVDNDKLIRTNKCKNDDPVEQDKVRKQVNFNVSEIHKNSVDSKTFEIPSTPSVHEIKDDQPQIVHAMKESINKPQQDDDTAKEKYNTESNEKDFHSMKLLNNNSKIRDSNNSHSTSVEDNVATSDCNTSLIDANKYIAPENINTEMPLAATSSEQISEVIPQEPENIAEMGHLHQKLENPKDTNEIVDLSSTEKVDVYDDVDNNPEGQIIANETSFENPHNYDPVQNTIPVNPDNVQQPEHFEHESEINAFEAEQKEMFYSEQADTDAYGYNQGEGNTGEYPEGYEQNDQYAYYDNVQQEQAYATNINEHEESTERYDPHYNEQYQGSYENEQPDNTVAYDNTNAYEQQQFQVDNQQFENVANYENREDNADVYQQENVTVVNEVQENVLSSEDQMYDQHLYAEHPGTQEHIEQQLIAEEGFTENIPIVTDGLHQDSAGGIENVIETTSSEEQVLDTKSS